VSVDASVPGRGKKERRRTYDLPARSRRAAPEGPFRTARASVSAARSGHKLACGGRPAVSGEPRQLAGFGEFTKKSSDGFARAVAPNQVDAGRQIRKPARFGNTRAAQPDPSRPPGSISEGSPQAGASRSTRFPIGRRRPARLAPAGGGRTRSSFALSWAGRTDVSPCSAEPRVQRRTS
jgi:hypothetical protein